MSIPYLITFRPYGRFYFGSPQSFGEGFYAISSKFPTQTTILGTLRATILQQNDLLDLEKRRPKLDAKNNIPDEVKQLTGTSKIVDLFDNDDNFGKILKISPVFIVRQGKGSECVEDFLLPIPSDVIFDYDEVEKEKDGTPKINGLKLLEFKEQNIGGIKVYSRNKTLEKLFSLEKRTKDYTADYLGGIKFWQSYSNCKSSQDKLDYHFTYLTKNIFLSDSQPGIAREKRKTIEEHFYTKNDFRLADEYSFGVIVHFGEENIIQDCDVIMGGEKSLFRLTAKKINTSSYFYSEHPIIKRFINENDFGDFDGSSEVTFNNCKLVAISPFISQESEFDGIDYAIINEIYVHRNIVMDNNKREKSNSYSAIPYGSVLFVNGKLSLTNKIASKLLKKIGYNFLIKFNRGV